MLGERIKQFRTAKGLSLRALAERAGCVSAQAISNYETGKDTPGSQVLLALASALDVPLSSLFQRISVPLGQPAFRKKKMSDARRRALESAIALDVERHLETEELFGLQAHTKFDIPDDVRMPIRTISDAEDRADQLRAAWGLGDHPIENLIELLEEHGMLVVCIEAGDDFDGCTYPEAEFPVVVVNGVRPGDRLRFDLAHELAHRVLRFDGDWDEATREKAAHRFAGAFLVPARRARQELGDHRARVTLFELADLKLKYGMSVQAWIHRARDLDILSENATLGLWRTLSIRGLRKSEIGTPCAIERTSRQRRLVARAYSDGIISESRAAELLGMPLAEISRLLMAEMPRDRDTVCTRVETAGAVGE